MAANILPGNGLHELRERITTARTAYQDGRLIDAESILEPLARHIPPIQRGKEADETRRMNSDPEYAACAWVSIAVSRLQAEIKVCGAHPVSVELALSCAEFGLSARLLREEEGRRINANITEGK